LLANFSINTQWGFTWYQSNGSKGCSSSNLNFNVTSNTTGANGWFPS